jgi:hypothetical protein
MKTRWRGFRFAQCDEKPPVSIAQLKLACAHGAKGLTAKHSRGKRVLAAGNAPKMIAIEIWPRACSGKQTSAIDQILLLR